MQMWASACVSCSAGGTEEGKECLWLVYSWTTECCLGQEHLTKPMPQKPCVSEADVLWVQCDMKTVVLLTLELFRACHICAAWALFPGGEGVCEQWHWFTALELHSGSPFLVSFWIREDDWGSDIQTLLLAAYGKSPSMPGTSPRLPAALLHTTPPPSLPACRAGLRSNYIWEDLVKAAAS